MSEPYIRVYASDMRADPKVMALPVAMRYALIQAWDIAKNGPGGCDELRSSDGRAMRERELRTLSSVSSNETRAMFERWRSVGLCEIDDGLVVFPSLAKRQGIDRTAALRMRRYRQRKRYGADRHDVTPERYGPVTGQNQNQNTRKRSVADAPDPSSPPTRKPDPIWDAFVDTMGPAPETKSGRGGWNHSAKELRDIQADAQRIPVAVAEHRRIWPGIEPTPQSVAKHWTRLTANGNGHTPPTLTAEDFDRLEAERDRITIQRRAAQAEEELPF